MQKRKPGQPHRKWKDAARKSKERKRQEYDPAFVEAVKKADAEPAVAGFNNVNDLLEYLNRED